MKKIVRSDILNLIKDEFNIKESINESTLPNLCLYKDLKADDEIIEDFILRLANFYQFSPTSNFYQSEELCIPGWGNKKLETAQDLLCFSELLALYYCC